MTNKSARFSRPRRTSAFGQSLLRIAAAILVLTAIAATLGLAALVPHASATSSPDWTVQSPGPWDQVTCPTTNDCWAIKGGSVSATTDGGAHWASQFSFFAPLGAAISCPNTSDCWIFAGQYTLGEQVFATTNGGASWSSQFLISGGAGTVDPDQISCSDASHCIIAATNSAGGLYSTSDGGITWSPLAIPFSFSTAGVHCASSTVCWVWEAQPRFPPAVSGSIAITTDGGSTWSSQTLPSGTGPLSGLSCVDTSHCWAIADHDDFAADGTYQSPPVVVTSDGGATWTGQGFPTNTGGQAGTLYLKSISCVASDVCWAVGAGAFNTTDGGSSWNSVLPPDPSGEFSARRVPTRRTAGSRDHWESSPPPMVETILPQLLSSRRRTPRVAYRQRGTAWSSMRSMVAFQ